jgi:hypothetical protein
MACFLVPVGEAIVTTIAQRVMDKKRVERIKLKWLNLMLWGGVVLLAIDHIWYGEMIPANISAMIHEMATLGVAMCIAITSVWMVLVVLLKLSTKESGEAIAANK